MSDSLEIDHLCFCCGDRNEKGLHLKFSYPHKGEAVTEIIVPDYFTGWKEIVHGGFLAMVLDEAMAHACISLNRVSVTAEITVRYVKPVKVGQRVRVTGEVKNQKSKIILTEGNISDETGEIVSKARGKFLAM